MKRVTLICLALIAPASFLVLVELQAQETSAASTIDSKITFLALKTEDMEVREALLGFVGEAPQSQKMALLDGKFALPIASAISVPSKLTPAQCNPPVVGCGSCKMHCSVTVVCDEGPSDINKCRIVKECEPTGDCG